MSGAWRAAIAGAVLALMVIAAGAVAVFAGLLPDLSAPEPLDRLLVIASAPDQGGTEVATYAFVVGSGEVQLLDTFESATVPSTSAKNAREALPFGGGATVAQALKEQTGGIVLPWIVVPERVWSGIVDARGGVVVDVPRDVSAYRDGSLYVIDAGERSMQGDELVALSEALDYQETVSARDSVYRAVRSGVATAIDSFISSDTGLEEIVAAMDAGEVKASVETDRIKALAR